MSIKKSQAILKCFIDFKFIRLIQGSGCSGCVKGQADMTLNVDCHAMLWT